MDVAHGCPICRTLAGCVCRSSLAQFFGLLESSLARVSTNIPTSTPPGKMASRALIDKLSGELAEPLSRTELMQRINAAGFKQRITKLRDHRWYLEVSDAERKVHFYIGYLNFKFVSKLVTRPSAFESFDDYQSMLCSLLSPNEIANLRITRLDFSLDYSLPLLEVVRGLDIKFKRSKVSYLDKGAVRTGVMVGSGSEKLLVYDKALESGTSSALTRIELQLSGKKLPTRKFANLQKAIGNAGLFDSLHLHDVQLKQPLSPSEIQKDRMSKLEHLLGREGLLAARQVLNEDHNFQRNFSTLMTVTPWAEQPQEAFENHIQHFFTHRN